MDITSCRRRRCRAHESILISLLELRCAAISVDAAAASVPLSAYISLLTYNTCFLDAWSLGPGLIVHARQTGGRQLQQQQQRLVQTSAVVDGSANIDYSN